MIWMKSILTGVITALLTVVAIVLATTVWFISISRGSGSGGIGAVSVGVAELLLLPLLAFALGFFWMFRRQQRRIIAK